MERRTETLQVARNSEEFRQPGQVENLMGWARYLWDSNAELKKRIATLETERQELEGQQNQTVNEMQRRIEELKGEGERLQQQLEEARAPPPPARSDISGAASDGSTVLESTDKNVSGSEGNGMPYGTKHSNYRPPTQS